MRLTGPPLTGLLFAGVLGMCALVLVSAGTGEDGVRMLIRATARSSAALFLLAFVARPHRQIWGGAASAWLLRSRRELGVSAALSHAVHLAGILWLAWGWPAHFETSAVTVVFGGLGFALFFAMALSSTDAAVAALGRRRWQQLHRTGAWYIWFIFAITFVPDPSRGWDALHAAAVLLFAGAAALRFTVWVSGRSRARASA